MGFELFGVLEAPLAWLQDDGSHQPRDATGQVDDASREPILARTRHLGNVKKSGCIDIRVRQICICDNICCYCFVVIIIFYHYYLMYRYIYIYMCVLFLCVISVCVL